LYEKTIFFFGSTDYSIKTRAGFLLLAGSVFGLCAEILSARSLELAAGEIFRVAACPLR